MFLQYLECIGKEFQNIRPFLVSLIMIARKILYKVAAIWRVLARSLGTTEYHVKKYVPVFGYLLMIFPALKWILTFSVKEMCTALWRANVKTSY